MSTKEIVNTSIKALVGLLCGAVSVLFVWTGKFNVPGGQMIVFTAVYIIGVLTGIKIPDTGVIARTIGPLAPTDQSLPPKE